MKLNRLDTHANIFSVITARNGGTLLDTLATAQAQRANTRIPLCQSAPLHPAETVAATDLRLMLHLVHKL